MLSTFIKDKNYCGIYFQKLTNKQNFNEILRFLRNAVVARRQVLKKI